MRGTEVPIAVRGWLLARFLMARLWPKMRCIRAAVAPRRLPRQQALQILLGVRSSQVVALCPNGLYI